MVRHRIDEHLISGFYLSRGQELGTRTGVVRPIGNERSFGMFRKREFASMALAVMALVVLASADVLLGMPVRRLPIRRS